MSGCLIAPRKGRGSPAVEPGELPGVPREKLWARRFDSRWTVTGAARTLRPAGADAVPSFALASSRRFVGPGRRSRLVLRWRGDPTASAEEGRATCRRLTKSLNRYRWTRWPWLSG